VVGLGRRSADPGGSPDDAAQERGWGRAAFDAVVIFRIPVLQQLYYLSDDQTEYPVRDRY
jgi:hypothetical protein